MKVTMCGDHSPQLLKNPWWEFACPVCEPEMYSVFTAADARENTPGIVECPFCNVPKAYANGVMVKHADDIYSVCRGSELSLYTAQRQMDGIIDGKSIVQFMEESPAPVVKHRPLRQVTKSKGESYDRKRHSYRPRKQAQIAIARPMVEELTRIRKKRGITSSSIHEKLHLGPRTATFREWEALRMVPKLGVTIAWAKQLQRNLVLKNSSVTHTLVEPEAAFKLLQQAREDQGLGRTDLASKLDLCAHSAIRVRETKSKDLRLADFIEWAAALGYDTSLEMAL